MKKALIIGVKRRGSDPTQHTLGKIEEINNGRLQFTGDGDWDRWSTELCENSLGLQTKAVGMRYSLRTTSHSGRVTIVFDDTETGDYTEFTLTPESATDYFALFIS